MAGSPEYINLLAEIGAEPTPVTPDWDGLEAMWDIGVKMAPYEPKVLTALAWVAFHIVAKQTNKSIEVILGEATQLHIDKNAGYAGADNPDPWANFRLSADFGISPVQGVLVRMTDKWSRIQSLRRNPLNDRIGESILDTLRDLAAYALIAVCLINEQKAAEVAA